jgi:hypothetical protein
MIDTTGRLSCFGSPSRNQSDQRDGLIGMQRRDRFRDGIPKYGKEIK